LIEEKKIRTYMSFSFVIILM